MGKVVRIEEYRRHHSRAADAGPEIWSCGVCGENAWTVTTSGRLRCRHCDTAAANLHVADTEPGPAHEALPGRAPSLPWNPLAGTGSWWWTWAPKS